MTIPEAIEILKAAQAGKVIEYKTTQDSQEYWIRMFDTKCESIIGHLAASYELRVKPEPREWWAVLYSQSSLQGGLWATKEEAVAYNSEREVIRVREVIDP